MKSFWSKEYDNDKFYISFGIELTSFRIGIVSGLYHLTIYLYPFELSIGYMTKKQRARFEEYMNMLINESI